ncbi:MAG TPA: DUF6600 domain-containing protein [Rubrivivax sp.]|nr:DUF6600 domain-containing protein [Rubrivivax sp.]
MWTSTAARQACRALCLALCGLFFGAGAATAQEDPPGRVGRVAALLGEVWVYEAEQGEWVAALHNRPFTGGDRLSTAPAASAELRIGSTTLLLGGSTELEALRLDDARMVFHLQRGSLAVRVRSREVASELEVQHPEARFAPLRAGLYRIDRQDDTSLAYVWRGDLQVEGQGMSMTMYAGQRARFWQDAALSDTRSQWLTPVQDDFALAVQREDQADARSAATLFVPPEMTGAEDLDRHGRWQQHPEFGAIWSPTVVVAGWVPYRHGQWVWLRPWGWTWVDDAPWGFAPFHYGRWLWWGNRWCWTPGPVVPRPVFSPALVGWVGGPRFSVTVGSRPVPAVGWVPLAPREHYRPVYRASPGHVNRLNPFKPDVQGAPPALGNRFVPGAVTVLPAPAMAPRQPVAAAALRAHEMVLPSQWQQEQFELQAPPRPARPARETTAPRAAIPAAAALQPAPAQMQPRPRPAPAAGAVAPLPGVTTVPLPNPPSTPFSGSPPQPAQPPRERGLPGANPPTIGTVRPLPAPAAVPATAAAAAQAPALAPAPVPAPTGAPAQPAAAHSPMPKRAAPHPFMPAQAVPTPGPAPAAAAGPPPAPPAVAPAVAPKPAAVPAQPMRSVDGRGRPDSGNVGERRRTPDSRQTTRER